MKIPQRLGRISAKGTLFFGAVITLAAWAPATSGTLQFSSSNWSAAQRMAKRSNKPLFLFVYSPNCNTSSRMIDQVFRRSEVGRTYNDNFINASISSNDPRYNVRVSNLGISHVPAFLYFSPDGKLLYKSFGYKEPQRFINMAQIALKENKMIVKRKVDKKEDRVQKRARNKKRLRIEG